MMPAQQKHKQHAQRQIIKIHQIQSTFLHEQLEPFPVLGSASALCVGAVGAGVILVGAGVCPAGVGAVGVFDGNCVGESVIGRYVGRGVGVPNVGCGVVGENDVVVEVPEQVNVMVHGVDEVHPVSESPVTSVIVWLSPADSAGNA